MDTPGDAGIVPFGLHTGNAGTLRPFCNLVFDDALSDDGVGFEINRPRPHAKSKPFINLVFPEDSLSDHWDDFEMNRAIHQRKPSPFTNLIFPENEMDDDWGQFEMNRKISHKTFTNLIFAEEELSVVEFRTNWPPRKGLTKINFPLSRDSDDQTGPEARAAQIRNAAYAQPRHYTTHSNPPRPSIQGVPAKNNRLEEILLQSLLDKPNETATREDLAMLARVIYNQNAETQRRQTSQARQIEDLQGRGQVLPGTPVIPGTGGRKSSQKVSRRPTTIRLHKLIRKAALDLMGRLPSQNKDPTPISSATPEEIKRFLANPTNPALGPQANKLVLDFNVGSGGRSFWNKKAALVFTGVFMQTNDDYDAQAVSKAFRTHILQLKNQYKQYMKFLADVAAMGDQIDMLATDEEKIYSSRISRRRGVLQRRQLACAEFVEQHIDLWNTMPLDAISGDESDHRNGQQRYIITTLPWRAAWVRQWMLVFDRLHLSTHFNGRRAKPGAFPHIRIPTQGNTGRRVDREFTTVPVGLPRNFYCPRWLSQQSNETIQNLNMQEPIDTSFSAYIIRTALTCRNVVSHRTPPIPVDEIPQDLIGQIIEDVREGLESQGEEMDIDA